ncbi:MAG: site-specific integrase [Oscillospiraceae bacterium]|nr:site-specific integrase [Oscillospiraceae bacterium]
MATITKIKDAYRIRVSQGYDVHGKQIIKSTTFKPPQNVTSGKAEKLAREYAVEFEKRCRGLTELRENMRFVDLADWYFENYATNELKEITAYNYRSQLNKHIIPEFGNTKLKDFNSTKLTAFFKNLELAPITIRKVYTIVQSIFARAVEQGFIINTPCKNVILPKNKTPQEKKPFLDENQAKALLKMLEGYSQFNTIIKALLYTGMRSGEVLALRWCDIDFENKVIHIENTLTDVAGKHWLQPPKTANSKRYIGLSEVLADIFSEHKEQQKEKLEALGSFYKYPEMVFTTDTGNYVDRSQLNTVFRRFVRNTDFDFATLHTLRHCNATLLINSGIDLKIVSEHLGHCDIGVTANIYADVLASSKAKVANMIALNLSN